MAFERLVFEILRYYQKDLIEIIERRKELVEETHDN